MFSSEFELGEDAALFTDLYELTMAASYFAERMHDPASFSFFIRGYPPGRGYFVAAGLEAVIRYLESFHFSAGALRYLEQTGHYTSAFLRYLEGVRFTGDVDAVPEGTICFVHEPLLEITAPIIEGQLVETFAINQLNLQTMLATKAARCVYAASGRPVVDFSLRRTQGTAAGMAIARCSYLAGAAGTSNVLAGLRWEIPTYGTMAHAFVQSFANEADAFRAFARSFPRTSTFLVDTYDTLAGVQAAISVALEMQRAGTALQAIRLDSGDLDCLSRAARGLLDDAGLHHVQIFASGGLNEDRVAALVGAGAPIDAFGVGTEMGVSGDAPWLDCAYKLVEYQGRGRLKLSQDKVTWLGRKQVWRASQGNRKLRDCLSLRQETVDNVGPVLGVRPSDIEPQLQPVMRSGRVVTRPPSLAATRSHFQAQFAALDSSYKDLRAPRQFPVEVSPA